MKKTILLLLFCSSTLLLSAQNHSKEDRRIKKQVLFGQITLEAFGMEICKNWYDPEYKAYKAKSNILKKLRKANFDDITITLIFGSWCHDSHREVPRFIKILEEINYPLDGLQMNALDTYKTSPDYDANAQNITHVPTIIISRNEKEIGRIIERPKKSLEKDLIKIISKN